ncbi:hypothetical protein ACFL9T_07660 [Thermodesulfobacteriota bacterium]
MLDDRSRIILLKIAHFYDLRKVGHVGALGFRRSTDLARLVSCFDELISREILIPHKTLFLDMGCADGRVNVLFSALAKKSIGIELDEWTLEEYLPLRQQLEETLREEHVSLPVNNIMLFNGDAMDESLYERITNQTGVSFDQFDLFYTYLTMQDEFAALISKRAKKGSVFMVYGLEKVLPKFDGLRLLTPQPLAGILALYQKQ